jgi:hypothetical protein
MYLQKDLKVEVMSGELKRGIKRNIELLRSCEKALNITRKRIVFLENDYAEKEKLKLMARKNLKRYRVEIVRNLFLAFHGKIVEIVENGDIVDHEGNKVSHHWIELTESEIKAIDESYWDFAKEIKEEH